MTKISMSLIIQNLVYCTLIILKSFVTLNNDARNGNDVLKSIKLGFSFVNIN